MAGRLAWLMAAAVLVGCAGVPPEPPLPRPEARRLDQPPTSAVEARLAAFRAERQVWDRLPSRPNGPWPLPVLAGWRRLLADLEPVWATPGPGAEVVYAYVALEAELDQCATRFGPPPEVVQAQVGAARIRLARARGWKPRRPSPAPTIEWPVTPVIVTSGYGHRRDPVHGALRFHAGIDLGGRRGDVVSTAAPGVVVAAGWHRGYGRRVVVRHGEALETWYGHLAEILVRPGDELGAGDPIGLMGASGRTTGPHLHFEVREHAEPVDPHAWLGRPLTDVRSLELTLR